MQDIAIEYNDKIMNTIWMKSHVHYILLLYINYILVFFTVKKRRHLHVTCSVIAAAAPDGNLVTETHCWLWAAGNASSAPMST